MNQRSDSGWINAYLKSSCDFSFRFPYFCLMLLFNRPMAESGNQPTMDLDVANWSLCWDSEKNQIIHTQYRTWCPHWDQTVREIIEKEVMACLNRNHSTDFYFLQADRDLCCLMNYPKPGTIDTIITRMNDVIEQLQASYGLNLSVAVSQEKCGDFNLPAENPAEQAGRADLPSAAKRAVYLPGRAGPGKYGPGFRGTGAGRGIPFLPRSARQNKEILSAPEAGVSSPPAE